MTTEDHYISAAILALQISDEEARRITGDEASQLRTRILDAFVAQPAATRIWEHLNSEGIGLKVDQGYALIPKLCPAESCYLMPLEDHGVDIYESTPDVIATILGECPYFEYAVVSKRLEWLLIENHHDVLIGVGAEVEARLAQVKRGGKSESAEV